MRLFVIPARKGSRRLPGKNKKLLGEKPLVKYSIDFANLVKQNGDSVCVTTDDIDIIGIANACKVDIVIERPKHLAEHNTSSLDTIVHALKIAEDSTGLTFSEIVLLQPTSPFRSVSDYNNMIAMYQLNHPELVVSVKSPGTRSENQFYIDKETGFKLDGNSGQNNAELVEMNGSIYIINTKGMLAKNAIIMNDIIAFKMDPKNSIDIDTQEDWNLALNYLQSDILIGD